MGKKMVRNPVMGDGTQVREVFLVPEDVTRRLGELEKQLSEERSKPAVIKTQERIVEREVIKDDPTLLVKYNAAMKELGSLRQSNGQVLEKIIEIPKIVRVNVIDRKKLIAAAIAGAIAWPVFIHLGRLIASFLK